MKRDLGALAGSPFDVLVIGGGVVGACIARDAALRGLSVALVDGADIGSGASANCLKIVHGGLRYLQRLDVRRMRASIRERAAWLRIAPHLVEPLPIVLPAYRRGLQRRAVLRAALAIDGALAPDRDRDAPPERRLPRGRMLSRAECLSLVPELDSPRLTGGALVHDAQLYSAERLVLEVARGAHAAGAVVANYVAFERPLLRGGRVAGGRARDRIGGGRIDVRARLVVNAAGAAAPDVAGRLTGHRIASPPFSLALNLVVPALGHAVGFAVPDGAGGGRKLFLTPWRGRTLIGTGHFGYGGPLDSPEVERCVGRFLEEVNGALPGVKLSRGDVVLVHRGLIPLERECRDGAPPLLRRHRVIDHAGDGVPEAVSVIAEKLTTARRIAEEVVDLLFRKLGRTPPRCVTAEVPLPGAPDSPARLLADALSRYGGRFDRDTLEHLTRAYGRDYERVLDAGREAAALGIDPGSVLGLQFIHAVREESACCVEDLLARRTEVGPRGAHAAAAVALAAKALGTFRAAGPDGRTPLTSPPSAGAPAARVSEAA